MQGDAVGGGRMGAKVENEASKRAPTDKTPRTARGERTLRKILDGAQREFGERGFSDSSIVGITQRAGVALGTFYTYFDSKEALFQALVRDMSAQVRDTAAPAFAQPAHGTIRTSNKKSQNDSKEETVTPLDPKLEGRSLVMILSANSDQIANQIGAVAANKEFTTSLATLMGHERFAAANDAEAASAREQQQSEATGAVVKAKLEALKDDASADQAKAAFLEILNKLAADLGHTGVFTSLDEAAEWLKYNRSRVVMESTMATRRVISFSSILAFFRSLRGPSWGIIPRIDSRGPSFRICFI